VNQTSHTPAQTPSKHLSSATLLQRVLVLATLLVLEVIPTSVYVQTAVTNQRIAASLVAFAALFICFGYEKAQNSYKALILTEGLPALVNWWYLAGHVAVYLVALGLSTLTSPNGTSSLVLGSFVSSSLFAVILAVFAFFTPALCFQLLRSTGSAWLYAGAAATAVSTVLKLTGLLWVPASRLTFVLVEWLLHLFGSEVVSDPRAAIVGTQRFSVEINTACSGMEGMGLMLFFATMWLWFFRKEFRFPQALLLIPAGLVTIFFFNAVRITLLILIGNLGAPNVAVHGFHSEAGWIAFNVVAIGFALSAQRLPWISRRKADRALDIKPIGDTTAAYLIPFLAILAAAMISRAGSGGFEWLYPLRFFAAAAALWFFRSQYASLNWHFGWFAPVAGGAIFAMWIGLDSRSSAHADNSVGAGLASLPQAARVLWLTFRTFAAVVTVSIAEELAFRGFLLRRLISREFETVAPRTFTYFSVLVSSVAFGILHGDLWLAGIAAGIVYAVVFLIRGRIGDAVVAHATTNALLAAWILMRGAWYMW
jgi:exosortase E/protease (VPEID-CTERM system)